jgi:hypothetical protein
METMTAAIDALTRRGFTENLSVVGNRLRVTGTRASFQATDLVIREYRRFEGVSDPDDMAILYAIEAKGGVRGTLVDAYGVYSDPLISAFVRTVSITEKHRWSR